MRWRKREGTHAGDPEVPGGRGKSRGREMQMCNKRGQMESRSSVGDAHLCIDASASTLLSLSVWRRGRGRCVYIHLSIVAL